MQPVADFSNHRHLSIASHDTEDMPMASVDELSKSLTELQTRLDSLRGRL